MSNLGEYVQNISVLLKSTKGHAVKFAPPWGKKVRLREAFNAPVAPIFRSGEMPSGSGFMLIAVGTVGKVGMGSFMAGACDFLKECPVQFGFTERSIPQTIGVPWEILEFAE